MVNELNILLDAACELGAVTGVAACGGKVKVDGMTKGREVFTLELVMVNQEDDNDT